MRQRASWDRKILSSAFTQAFVLLRPDFQWKNPVMFVVEIGTILTLAFGIKESLADGKSLVAPSYFFGLAFWLFLTVLFANFATALAEARGRAQTESLKKTRAETIAYRLNDRDALETVSSSALIRGDRVAVQAGQTIPGDGEILEGAAYVDESAITGESAPVLRESGTDHSGVTAGTVVLTDRIVVQITSSKGNSFLDRMIALIEGSIRQRSPNEIELSMLLSALTLIFLIVVGPLWAMAYYTQQYRQMATLGTDIPTLIALLVCLIPTTIGALLAAIGIAGMDRALQANIIAQSGAAVESAGDIDVVLIDKTGTITTGNRQATQMIPVGDYSEEALMQLAVLASVSDKTPEGKSIKQYFEKHEPGRAIELPSGSEFIPFTAVLRMSGVDLPDGRKIRKGAPNAIEKFIAEYQGTWPENLNGLIAEAAKEGATPLVIAEDGKVAGLIVLEDVLKHGIHEKFLHLKRMGLKVVMVTGDNPLTAAAIAKKAGIDEFLAEAIPEDKLAYIRKEQAEGKLIAMMGDGTNDAPALAQAYLGVAMNAGTEAAKEAANMVDLDSDPTKLIRVIEIGKQLLMTRSALTTFSITNDVAKYFAIIPAMFADALPWLKQIDIMHLHSPTSAIFSAVIFNALIIPSLIPIALKGIRYRPQGAGALLRRNLTVWGLGGVIVPFIGIKLIDWIVFA